MLVRCRWDCGEEPQDHPTAVLPLLCPSVPSHTKTRCPAFLPGEIGLKCTRGPFEEEKKPQKHNTQDEHVSFGFIFPPFPPLYLSPFNPFLSLGSQFAALQAQVSPQAYVFSSEGRFKPCTWAVTGQLPARCWLSFRLSVTLQAGSFVTPAGYLGSVAPLGNYSPPSLFLQLKSFLMTPEDIPWACPGERGERRLACRGAAPVTEKPKSCVQCFLPLLEVVPVG